MNANLIITFIVIWAVFTLIRGTLRADLIITSSLVVCVDATLSKTSIGRLSSGHRMLHNCKCCLKLDGGPENTQQPPLANTYS